MKDRDLPEVVKATFGVASPLRVKLLTSVTLLLKKHRPWWPAYQTAMALEKAHSILPFAPQNYYFKSLIPDPDPYFSGGRGQH